MLGWISLRWGATAQSAATSFWYFLFSRVAYGLPLIGFEGKPKGHRRSGSHKFEKRFSLEWIAALGSLFWWVPGFPHGINELGLLGRLDCHPAIHFRDVRFAHGSNGFISSGTVLVSLHSTRNWQRSAASPINAPICWQVISSLGCVWHPQDVVWKKSSRRESSRMQRMRALDPLINMFTLLETSLLREYAANQIAKPMTRLKLGSNQHWALSGWVDKLARTTGDSQV